MTFNIRKVLALPTQARLQELFDYDPETGVFHWRNARGPRAAGAVAGNIRKDGYVRICINWNDFLAHRLAWIYMHGLTIGGAEVDHIDGNPSNNAIANLRLATSSEQRQNSRPRSSSNSPLKGSFRVGTRWKSQIMIGGRNIYLGTFDTPEQAHAAYCAAAHENFGDFARLA